MVSAIVGTVILVSILGFVAVHNWMESNAETRKAEAQEDRLAEEARRDRAKHELERERLRSRV